VSTLQTQRDSQRIVSGPYDSRRFGRTIEVNPLPTSARFCNFDCVYCACATEIWPLDWELRPQFPSAERIDDALRAAANTFATDDLDSITIAGHGEPTLSPQLSEIINVVSAARDRDWPQARTLILSNGTMCHKPNVRDALAKLDERVIKLDAGSNWILDQLNRPVSRLSLSELLRRISMMPEIIVQSMFVHGPVDNTGPKEIEAWAGWLSRLKPASVQIYSLNQHPAKSWVRHVSHDELESIAAYVESTTRIPARVF
jgi:wyosine [tRNA(Phe)-imidazoG37] synthetase (radical SAM superfamily)